MSLRAATVAKLVAGQASDAVTVECSKQANGEASEKREG